jgi:short subunit dehydrogenase-like uncharacterized protein
MTWMIYGANGYTGALVAEEAVARGHRPVLAGRSAEKIKPLAERLNLEYRVFSLDNSALAARELSGLKAVYHAAGPFVHTSAPMIMACLQAGVHYLDITGEYPVFENTFAHDARAKAAGVALISGVGFDVIPTDCLAKYVADQVPGADRLEIAFAALTQTSAGTTHSMIELMRYGGRTRRDGQLVPLRLGHGVRDVQFSDKSRLVVEIPWGDISTAYRTTGVPNISTYLAYPPAMARTVQVVSRVIDVTMLLRSKVVRQFAHRMIASRMRGPSASVRQSGRCYLWAQASRADGTSAQAWLETPEAYQFTVVAGVRVIERLLTSPTPIVGATTPALAFGADFVLDIPGCARFDQILARAS